MLAGIVEHDATRSGPVGDRSQDYPTILGSEVSPKLNPVTQIHDPTGFMVHHPESSCCDTTHPVSPHPKPRIKIHGRIPEKVSGESEPVTLLLSLSMGH